MSQAVYSITDKLGACVILNIESFEKGRQKTRVGTECDKSMIEKTFSSFGYEVHPVQNPTKNDITLKMNEILQTDHTESSSFICFIMSHGTTKNKIITHDNIEMDLNDIIKLSDIPALEGKPKIFVVQTCRGGGDDRGMEAGKGENVNPFPITNVEFEAMIPIANKPDFLLIFATPPGYVSYRNANGSAFIQMFCHVLEKHRHKATVCALLQRLIFTISCIPFRVKDEIGWFLQVPYFSSTLTKSLKLHHSASSGDIRFKKVNTIKYSRAEVARRRMVRLIQAVDGVDANDVPFHISGDSLYHKFLLEETSGCYDMSLDRVRSCLIIDRTTDGAINPAEQDRKAIKQTMESLKFTCHIFKGKDILAEKYEESMTNTERLIGCFFCFIQINEEDYTPDNKFLTEIIGTVKNKSCLLHKPKIFIIQPYDSVVNSVTDSLNHSSESCLSLPVRYSKESDVLIIQTLPVESGQKSFIDIFCKTYLEWAEKVPMMGFLERILPTQHQEDWMALRPVVCSTMRKHLLITDSFYVALYKSENLSQEEELCEELEMIASELEERIRKEPRTTDSSNPQDLLRKEDDNDFILSFTYRNALAEV